MKIKKLLALALTLAMVLSMLVMPASAAELSDIAGHWAEDSIERWVDASIITGYPDGTFGTEDPITRAQFAAILARTFGLSGKGEHSFPDVESQNHWAKDYIYACAAAGIVNGYTDGTFGADNPINRQEAMTMFVRAMNLYPYMESQYYDDFLKDWFADAADVADWAKEYAVAMVNNGAMQGTLQGDALYLRPTANISRAEVAVILDRVVAIYVSEQGGVSTTTQAQIDKGMMGDRLVVHTAADAVIKGNGVNGFDVETDTDSASASGNYEVMALYGKASFWLYCDEGCTIEDGSFVRSRMHELPAEQKEIYIEFANDGTEAKSEYLTEYSYNEENWNLEEVKFYEDDELRRTVSCEFDAENRPAEITVDGVLRETYEYDEQGNRIAECVFDSEGEKMREHTTVYNEQGQITERTTTYFDWYYEDDVRVDYTYGYTSKYTYDAQGREVLIQEYDDEGNLESERTWTYGEEYLESEYYKNYGWYYEGEQKVTYVSIEESYTYNEDGYMSEYVWASYNPDGSIDSYEKRVRTHDDLGRQVKQEEYSAEGLLNTVYTTYEGDTWRRTSQYCMDASNKEIWKNVFERTEEENTTITKTTYYENGVVVRYSEVKSVYNDEINETWQTDYDVNNEVVYKEYYYNEYLEDGLRHHHNEREDDQSKRSYDTYYYRVLLPDTYIGNDWDYYYY